MNIESFFIDLQNQKLKCHRLTSDDFNFSLWACHSKDIPDKLIASPETVYCLNQAEIEKFHLYQLKKDRATHLAARIMVRHMLSEYHNISPCAWHFSNLPHGKPVVSKGPGYIGIDFSISHCDDLTLCAVSQHAGIGIDIEYHSRMIESDHMVSYILTHQEHCHYYAQDYAHRNQTFFRYWTLKEAYLKARGCGFSVSPKLITFNLDSAEISALFSRQLNDSPDNWRFGQELLYGKYIFSWAHLKA